MKNSIISLVLFTAVFLISCTQKSKEISLTQIREILETEQLIEKAEPFQIRPVNDHLNEKWIGQAVSYGCYRQGQAPGKKGPSKAEILEDLNIIKQHWNLIRVYNADDDTQRILEVIEENDLPLKVMLGVWLANETDMPEMKQENQNNVLKCIELVRNFPEIIYAVNVGNETQVFWSWHKMATNDLIRYIRTIRNNVSVPVTTADDYNFWNKPESKVVAEEIDFVVTHIYPLWNGKTLENAILWLDETYRDIQQQHPAKQIVLGEIGWATDYNSQKKGDGEQGSLIKGKVGIEAQQIFLIELDKWINKNKITTFLFEAFDEPWKGGGDKTELHEIEKNWGVFYENRTPKKSFVNYLKDKEKRYDKEET